MTPRQERVIEEAKKALGNARKCLDFVMYYSDGVTDQEHEKLRGAYDKICEATDKLY